MCIQSAFAATVRDAVNTGYRKIFFQHIVDQAADHIIVPGQLVHILCVCRLKS